MMKTCQIAPTAVRVCALLEKAGFQGWVVGGCVRDTLMNRCPNDWDVATDARPETVTTIMHDAGLPVVPTGIEHGTVTVIVPVEGTSPVVTVAVEVTTFRGDGTYTDGRRPDSVQFVNSIEEDLARRDFTINAMAFRPRHEAFADPFHGQQDIKFKWISAVGDPCERFMEDGLRVMRACRFSAQLGFFIGTRTQEAMKLTPVREKCLGVAKERIATEFWKLMTGEFAKNGVCALEETGLLTALFPGVPVTTRLFDTMPILHGENEEETFALRTAALLHPIGVNQTALAIHNLRLPLAEKRLVVDLVTALYNVPKPPVVWTDGRCRKWAAETGKRHLDAALALVEGFSGVPEFADMVRRVMMDNPALEISELALNGTEVAEVLDVEPGKQVGEALRWLLSEVIRDPRLNKPHLLTMRLLQEFMT
jgi:tRNA nucleotidyltransferase (CCA-adding enzyme)